MILPMPTIPVPLSDDGHGGIRIGDCLFPLDILIRDYERGADAESIVHAYPVLRLADVYAVIAYYLQNKLEVEAYLNQRETQAEALRRTIESAQAGRGSLRDKLLARRAQQEKDHATSCGR